MRTRLSGRLLVAIGAVIALVGCVSVGAAMMGNDFICSKAEQQAMSEFPHYDGADPDWESNFKITGGCTTTYTTRADPEAVRTYYRDHLRQRGWTVTAGSANTFPIYCEAERGDLGYFLMFEGADPFAPAQGEEAIKAGTQIVMESPKAICTRLTPPMLASTSSCQLRISLM